MPSKSLQKFENNLIVDVKRIIETHQQINHKGLGRRGLGHITRSGVLMLCAAWEMYIEEILKEGALYFSGKLVHPNELPKPVQKELSRTVKDSKHELKPLELAGDGWKSLYQNHVSEVLNGLNTPKSGNLNPLFTRFLGVEKISDEWAEEEKINNFVSVRGDIAHTGAQASYVTITNLTSFKTLIEKTVLDTDNFIAQFLRDKTPGQAMPWRRRLN